MKKVFLLSLIFITAVRNDAVIRVYDQASNVIETHEHTGDSSTYTTFGSTLTIIGERNVQ